MSLLHLISPKTIAYFILDRLKEKTTWIAFALACATYFGVEIKVDCTGINLCITEDLWSRILEFGFYIISGLLALYKENNVKSIGQKNGNWNK